MRWLKYCSFSFSISPSNEHPGLSSFRMDWFDLLVVQGTLKSLLQYHSSKASIFWRSAFFMVQLSHPHMTTGKSIALTVHILPTSKCKKLIFWISRSNIEFSNNYRSKRQDGESAKLGGRQSSLFTGPDVEGKIASSLLKLLQMLQNICICLSLI